MSTDKAVAKALEGPLKSWLNEGSQRALEALRRNRVWGIEAAEEWFFDQDTALLTFTFPERESSTSRRKTLTAWPFSL
jgi:hypothetical protein